MWTFVRVLVESYAVVFFQQLLPEVCVNSCSDIIWAASVMCHTSAASSILIIPLSMQYLVSCVQISCWFRRLKALRLQALVKFYPPLPAGQASSSSGLRMQRKDGQRAARCRL